MKVSRSVKIDEKEGMTKLDEFINALRQKGLNVTYQRLLIFKHLINTNTHPTADEIYQAVITEYPSISMATVYKILEILTEHKLIAKVTPLHDLARFDGDTSMHHHLVCLRCRKIVDVHHDALNNLPIPSNNGFEVCGYRVQYEGICEVCASKPRLRLSKDECNEKVTFCGKESTGAIES